MCNISEDITRSLLKYSSLFISPWPAMKPEMVNNFLNADIGFLRKFYDIANSKPNIELEFKFQNVSKECFDRLLSKMLAEFPESQRTSITIFDNIVRNPRNGQDIRISEIHEADNKAVKQVYSKEQLSPSKMLSEFDIKVSINAESAVDFDCSKFPVALFREKQRFHFTTEMFVFDLSVVKNATCYEELTKKNFQQVFEVEIEFIGNKNPKYIFREEYFLRELSKLILYVEEQFQQCSGFIQVTTKTEAARAQQFFNNLVSAKEKFIEPRPITLHRKNLAEVVERNYSVSPKPDGLHRYIVFEGVKKDDKQFAYMYDYGSHSIQKTTIAYGSDIGNTIIDGEWMPKIQKFLAFDILVFQGADVRDSNLEQRRANLQQVLTSLDASLISIKKMFASNIAKKSAEIMKQVQDGKCPYENDGLIFTPPGKYIDPAFPIFKWKPGNYNTIDFALVLEKNCNDRWGLYNMTTNADKELVYKGQSIKRFPFHNTLVWNPNDKLADGCLLFDGCVAECFWDDEKQTFVPSRLRFDKIQERKFGNFIQVALDNWKSIQNPVTISDIENYSAAAKQPTVSNVSAAIRNNIPVIPSSEKVSEAISAGVKRRLPAKSKEDKPAPKKPRVAKKPQPEQSSSSAT